MEILVGVLVIYLALRVIAWATLRLITSRLSEVVAQGRKIYASCGTTVGAIREAGEEEHLDALKLEGKMLYRLCVPLASFLYGWYLLTWVFQRRIRKAAGSVGDFVSPTQHGTHMIYSDIRGGWVPKDKYYNHIAKLDGMAQALKSAKLFFFFI